VGFCYLFSDKSIEIPTLWAAIAGSRRPCPTPTLTTILAAPGTGKIRFHRVGWFYYGKVLRDKPTLVSLELLPYFYALSPNYGDIEDYLERYEEGKLSVEAKNNL
jgi:hypothetical protein